MTRALTLVAAFALAATASAITVDTVPVGDVGNVDDPATGNFYGAVNYAYRIGKYKVTVRQYTAFLNAVAASDPFGLYGSAMQTDLNIAGIARTGAPGNYTYTVIGSPNHPISEVTWYDAARFVNWLQNGQPIGPEGPGTTETGAYTLNNPQTLATVTRNAGATWFIPTENEWYKAAYYQPTAKGGDSDGYWAYPMRTNSVPYSDQPPGATPDNTRVGNFFKDDGVVNSYDDGYAVTGSATNYSPAQNYLTDVGAYSGSASFYGTFDQGSALQEWTETIEGVGSDVTRVIRGGCWDFTSSWLSVFGRDSGYPIGGGPIDGFRVGSVPGAVGDFDENGNVDDGDYVSWRKSGGTHGDYATWRANFGTTTGGAGTAFSAVPEPSTILFVVGAFATLTTLRRKPTTHNRV